MKRSVTPYGNSATTLSAGDRLKSDGSMTLSSLSPGRLTEWRGSGAMSVPAALKAAQASPTVTIESFDEFTCDMFNWASPK